MANDEKLSRAWVEVTGESTAERIVLRPKDYPLPPSRGGRRVLDLSGGGVAKALGYGAVDTYETKGAGIWTVDNDRLRIDLSGWKGTYKIEELGDEILVLRPD